MVCDADAVLNQLDRSVSIGGGAYRMHIGCGGDDDADCKRIETDRTVAIVATVESAAFATGTG